MEQKPRHLNSDGDKKLLKDLHKLVNEKVQQLPKTRINSLKIKLFVFPAIYFVLYFTALTQSERLWLFFLMYSLMGFMVVVIFCELIHELCHKNIFKKAHYNLLAFHLFDLLGANSYIWQQRHLRLHHLYPNVNGWDADVEQKGPVAIFPNEPNQNMKKYQHRYVFFLYPLYMINWILVRDFRDYFSSKRVIKKAIEIPQIEYIKLILFKTVYIFTIVLVPWLFAEFSLIQSLGGFIILTVSCSILAMIVLLTPHVNSGNEFPLTDKNGEIDTSWFRHQLISTNDIDNTNWFIRNVMGNFNYHLAHHLFPRISSVYAPEVTQVVKSFLQKHQLPYKSYPLSISLRKHHELIRNNALHIHETDF